MSWGIRVKEPRQNPLNEIFMREVPRPVLAYLNFIAPQTVTTVLTLISVSSLRHQLALDCRERLHIYGDVGILPPRRS